MKIGPADPEILRLRAKKSGTTQNWLLWQRPLRNREKMGWVEKIHANTFHLVKKIMKIGPVDPEIALLMLKKITEGKIYSPVNK